MDGIRLNKYLAECGVASRREADRAINEGRVSVDGITATLGLRVTGKEEILYDGAVVHPLTERILLAVYKPVGVVCTTARFKGEKNIVDMVDYGQRIFPIGRLDKASEGLVLMTNDGELSKEIASADGMHEKEYEVTIRENVTEEFLTAMRQGVTIQIDDVVRTTRKCKVKKTGAKSFNIILTQGFNRQIRRMCEALGCRVVTLKRIRIMNVQLGDMKAGSYRELSAEEIRDL